LGQNKKGIRQKYKTEFVNLGISFGIILFSDNFAKDNKLQKITNL